MASERNKISCFSQLFNKLYLTFYLIGLVCGHNALGAALFKERSTYILILIDCVFEMVKTIVRVLFALGAL